jgi:nucleotide-binding universal stress UspA family protein
MDDPATRMKAAHAHLVKFLEGKKATAVKAIIREGDPGLIIADYADEVHADLIVIPSHGYHGVQRLLLGSVAERVLRHANCPVLVLRRPT